MQLVDRVRVRMPFLAARMQMRMRVFVRVLVGVRLPAVRM
jgi:hypothetical protein